MNVDVPLNKETKLKTSSAYNSNSVEKNLIYNFFSGYLYIFPYINIRYESELKRSYVDVISAVNVFFIQWNPSTAILKKEVCGLC